MKLFALQILSLITFATSFSQACIKGDTSKVLLIVAESEGGEENKVIGTINTADGSLARSKTTYIIWKNSGNTIIFERFSGTRYVFDRRNLITNYKSYCYPVIFAQEIRR